MRMAFGIAALLVTIGVIVWIMSAITLPQTKQALDVKKRVEPQVQQWGGKSATGQDARQSITLAADSSAGRMTSVVVTSIQADGPMATYFGLQKGDSIVEIAPQGGALMPVKEMSSVGEVKDLLASSYANSQQIVVVRNDQRITLPATDTKPQPPGAAPAADALDQQLQGITAPR